MYNNFLDAVQLCQNSNKGANTHEHKAYGKTLSGKTLHNISEAFNKHFEGYPAMQVSVIVASQTFLKISKIFNKR